MAHELKTPAHPTDHELLRQDVTIAAVADIHVRTHSAGAFQAFFADIGRHADILLLGGDLTDRGLPEEAHILAKELNSSVKVPVIAVLGNHDCESGHEEEVVDILATAGVTMLDGESCEFHGVGIAGVKGFAGGFGARMLQAWGEPTIKGFVREAVDEVLKLESALSQLHMEHRIVLTHYAPIRATVVGEAPEIFPFLGSSRLEEPLVTFGVTAAFHGHAHAGSPQGHARGDIPVYNVAMPLLGKCYPDDPPYRLLKVELTPSHGVAQELGTSYEVRKDLDS